MPPLRLVREEDVQTIPAHQTLWMKRVLIAACAYNVVWGAVVILFPDAIFRMVGAQPPHDTAIWQCLGMVIGVYGVGYALAARNPLRHWPIVLVGLLGKIFGPIGFLRAAMTGALPWSLGWMIITNDLIWWMPFAFILRAAWREATAEESNVTASPELAMASARSQNGESLYDLSRKSPVLVVFLRHLGCVFCGEALADLWQSLAQIETRGTRLCLVHMGTEEQGLATLGKHYLVDVPRISDPERRLYRAFGLTRGTMGQVFGWRAIRRGIASVGRHGAARPVGDALQMQGAFLVCDGQIVRAFRAESIADRPDYVELSRPVQKPRTVSQA